MKNKNQLSQKQPELDLLLQALFSDPSQLNDRQIATLYNETAAAYGLDVLPIATIRRLRAEHSDKQVLPAEITAKVAGVSPSLVKGIRTGGRNATKGKGKRAAMADDLLRTGFNELVKAVSNIVKSI